MNLLKTYSKLSEAQQRAVERLAKGCFSWTINSQSFKALNERGLLAIDGSLYDKPSWWAVLGIDESNQMNPYWDALDHLTRRQLEVVQSLVDGYPLDPKCRVLGLLVRHGVVIRSDDDFELEPNIRDRWPAWVEENAAKLEKPPENHDEVTESPLHLRTIVLTGLPALSPEQMRLWMQLPKDVQDFVAERVDSKNAEDMEFYMQTVIDDERMKAGQWRAA